MEERKHRPIEEMDFFILFEQISDEVGDVVRHWRPFEKETLGKQLVRAIDSVGFNLSEADGRFKAADGLNLLIIARGSAREARTGVRKALRRGLIEHSKGERLVNETTEGLKQLNNFIRYRRESVEGYRVRETASVGYGYESEDY